VNELREDFRDLGESKMHQCARIVVIVLMSVSCAAEEAANNSAELDGNRVAHSSQQMQVGTTSLPRTAQPPFRAQDDPNCMRAIIQRTASVVEGVIQDVSYTYDEKNGPRTVHTLQIESIYSGTPPNKSVKLSQLGGPLNDGRFISTSYSEDFVIGARYIVFLSADTWFVTPFSTKALRVGLIAGREVLTNSEGHVLKRIVPEGMLFSTETIPAESEPVRGSVSQGPSATSVTPQSLYAALTRSDFKRLLSEAIDAEGEMPGGTFAETSSPKHEKWNLVQVAPRANTGDAK